MQLNSNGNAGDFLTKQHFLCFDDGMKRWAKQKKKTEIKSLINTKLNRCHMNSTVVEHAVHAGHDLNLAAKPPQPQK